MRTAHHIRRRAGFTLVEMMVSSALIIFMMYILSTAFVAGLEAFRVLKVQGDMQEKLRSATTTLRGDLCRPHFECADSAKQGGETLSSLRVTASDWYPPDKGYFRIYQGTGATDALEGLDPDDPAGTARLTRATDHVLQFTIKLDGRRLHEFFSTTIGTTPLQLNTTARGQYLSSYNTPEYKRPNNVAASTEFTTVWAEVTYFLCPYDTTLSTATGGPQRFALFRRVKLLTDGSDARSGPPFFESFTPATAFVTAPAPDAITDLSTWAPNGSTGPTFINRPQDVTAPIRRTNVAFGTSLTDSVGQPLSFPGPGRQRIPALSPQNGGDLLLSDVLSFKVKATWDAPSPAGGAAQVAPLTTNARQGWPVETAAGVANPDFPFDTLPGSGRNPALQSYRIFDTWSKERSTGSPSYDYAGSPDPEFAKDGARALWNGGHFSSGGPTASNAAMPLRVRVRALQIEIRVWDVKSKQTRQVTIIQDV